MGLGRWILILSGLIGVVGGLWLLLAPFRPTVGSAVAAEWCDPPAIELLARDSYADGDPCSPSREARGSAVWRGALGAAVAGAGGLVAGAAATLGRPAWTAWRSESKTEPPPSR